MITPHIGPLLLLAALFPVHAEPLQSDTAGQDRVTLEREDGARALRDPRSDGWTTEVLAEEVAKALSPLKGYLAHGDDGHAEGLAPWSKGGVALRLPAEGKVEQHGAFGVLRWDGSTGGVMPVEAGAEDAALLRFARTLRGGLTGDAHAKLKVVTVAEREGGTQTELLLEVGGREPGVGLDAVASVSVIWGTGDGGRLVLRSLEVLRFERTVLALSEGRLLEDKTADLLKGPVWHGQLQVGLDRWARRIEERVGMGLYKHSGVAVGDMNGDGREDLYVCQPAGLPNLILLQGTDGQLVNVDAGVARWLDHTSSAVIVDLNGDGRRDLVTATAGGVVVHENTGGLGGGPESPGGVPVPAFKMRVALVEVDTDLYGLSAADVDLDGDLDLYVTADFANRRDGAQGERARFDYVDANDGGRNVLWLNDGDFQFRDATDELGLDVHNRRHSLAATWTDVDLDGDVDLYVANDYGANCLYVSSAANGGPEVDSEGSRLFREVAAERGIVDRGSGMSVDFGDPNRDGRPDALVANMWSSAGRRITTQSSFAAGASEAEREQFGRFAKGNTLFVQGESGAFEEVSDGANIERGRWAWGTPFVDLDGDGYEDLLVGNGYVTSTDTDDL